jgi:hypothetical protein
MRRALREGSLQRSSTFGQSVALSAACLLICGIASLSSSSAAEVDWPTRREQIAKMIRDNALGAAQPTAEELARMPIAPVTRAIVPRKVDLSDGFPAPGDQGDLGSCTGWATAYARAYYAHASEEVGLDDKRSLPSPNFIYDTEKIINNNLVFELPEGGARTCNFHTNLVRAALVLARYGTSSNAEYPQHQEKCIGGDELDKLGGVFPIKGAMAIRPPFVDNAKVLLAAENPVVVQMFIGDDFKSIQKGDPPFSGPGGTSGHAVAIVGYDDDKKAFHIINSWGKSWGDDGFAWVSYDYMRKYVDLGMVLIPKTPVKPRKTFINLQELKCGDAPDNSAARRPKAQCDMLEALRAPLSESDLPKVDVVGGATLKAGERMAIEIETPGFPSYIQAFYLQADRRVVHLVQTDPMAPKQYPPHTKLVFGDGGAGHGSFRVSPPYGDEMIVAVASRSPLFPAKRPQGEPDTAVVASLQQALAAMGPKAGAARDVTAWFASVRTQP